MPAASRPTPLAGAGFDLRIAVVVCADHVSTLIVQEMGPGWVWSPARSLRHDRERFGVKITFYLMILLILTNLGNTWPNLPNSAFIGDLSAYLNFISIPISILFSDVAGCERNYRSVEKVFLAACLF